MAGRKKILLVVPNYRWAHWDYKSLWNVFPYNLCLLAAVLEPAYDVRILDANIEGLPEKAFAKRILGEMPDVVGISMLSDDYKSAAHIAARIVKETNPSATVVLGGVHATMNPELAMKDRNIDYTVIGEGEQVLPALLGSLFTKAPLPARGLAFRKGGKIRVTGHADLITDLDHLPRPAYDKIDFSQYASARARLSVDAPRVFPNARMFTSRGCPIGCAFCQVEAISGKTFRARSAEHVLKELVWLKETYGIRSVTFDDDNLLADRQRAKAIFQGMLDRKLDLEWYMPGVAVFLLNDRMLTLMKKSGCRFIDLAIESGVKRILHDIIRKPIRTAHVKRVIRKARELGLDIGGNFIIGFPGETWDEIRTTLRYAEALKLDYVKIFLATPLKDTRLYDLARKTGCLRPGFSFERIRWSRGQIETDEFSARDLTLLRAYEWDRINFTDRKKRQKIADMMGISLEALNKIRKDTRQAVS